MPVHSTNKGCKFRHHKTIRNIKLMRKNPFISPERFQRHPTNESEPCQRDQQSLGLCGLLKSLASQDMPVTTSIIISHVFQSVR
ncbi:hypothetical protein GX50_01830 [[Emmonsia] crescens]|uniref:Uncharacterized protein n=1 Tax=[Emmonsia] crescens TaxID=73230 RepID=A0A2B7ZN08_9EURO|nr:hypothetical protein GX50_01830 [Emmonsia crescens]